MLTVLVDFIPAFVTPGATHMNGARVGPHREFAPVVLFTKAPAVIAPQGNDRVVTVFTFVQGVKQPPDIVSTARHRHVMPPRSICVPTFHW
jgi:hypothetical protein